MNIRISAFICLVLALAASASPLAAQRRRARQTATPPTTEARLNLTDAQKTQLDQIAAAAAAALAALSSERLTPSERFERVGEILLKEKADALALFTPEQQKAISDMKSEHAAARAKLVGPSPLTTLLDSIVTEEDRLRERQ